MKNKRQDFLTKEPLSRQVYDYLLTRIERGDYAAHDKLPSVRSLAEQLGVHRLTVFKSYQQLVHKGKIYAKDRSGYYVMPCTEKSVDIHNNLHSSTSVRSITGADTLTIQQLLSPVIPASINFKPPVVSSPLRTNLLSELQAYQVDYQFSKALIDPALLPNAYMSEYVKKVFDLYPKLLGTYSTVQGDEELRLSLAEYFKNRHQFFLLPEDILITSGALQAIDLVARLMIKPGDTVIVERPTYSAAIDIFRQQGAHIVTIPMLPDGYDMDQLEAIIRDHKPRMMYVNPTFHNPTGYVLPASKRKRLVELAEEYHFLITEDDTTYDMYFEEEPPLPIYGYDTEGVVMYIRSFSKYIAPGLRIAAVLCRPWLMKELLTIKSLADGGSPLLGQKIFLHYFTSSRMQTHMEKLRIALSLRKEAMEKCLAGTTWEWISPKGGLDLWIQLPKGVSSMELLRRSLALSVSFVPGPFCDPDAVHHSSSIRLSYCYTSERQIEEGMLLLKTAYDSLVRST
ncbi:PLP-dependent aminotransferase family protein [Paenibacillus sp. Marseille-Q4541]|uniref:aminotransferase-like domain-containing protein n=1 Tax=Paenibacillus sp. Marseille-Q4541 TaxID=2831522 RepID=UPI001BA8B05A|nr:PLP-dependent aminotransferase family protein [Paenibacillus sp. Marseille-Q4541]